MAKLPRSRLRTKPPDPVPTAPSRAPRRSQIPLLGPPRKPAYSAPVVRGTGSGGGGSSFGGDGSEYERPLHPWTPVSPINPSVWLANRSGPANEGVGGPPSTSYSNWLPTVLHGSSTARPAQQAPVAAAPQGAAPTGNPDAFPIGATPEDDAAWAEKFRRTYEGTGRQLTDADWQHRWYAALGTPGYVGGGGGSAPNAAFGGLPSSYVMGFEGVMGPMSDFYGTTPDQAQKDFESLSNLWTSATNLPIADTDWGRIWNLIGLAKREGMPFNFPNALDAARRSLAAPPQAANVSQIGTSEI